MSGNMKKKLNGNTWNINKTKNRNTQMPLRSIARKKRAGRAMHITTHADGVPTAITYKGQNRDTGCWRMRKNTASCPSPKTESSAAYGQAKTAYMADGALGGRITRGQNIRSNGWQRQSGSIGKSKKTFLPEFRSSCDTAVFFVCMLFLHIVRDNKT